MFLVVLVLFILVVGSCFIGAGFDERRGVVVTFGILLLTLASFISFISGFLDGYGYLETAENKLSPGETYECIPGSKENDGVYYSVVKTGNGDIYGLRFKETPPLKGMVSKTGGKITFLPIVDEAKGVTIKNPLPGAETPKPANNGK